VVLTSAQPPGRRRDPRNQSKLADAVANLKRFGKPK
jgi:hypothetical protein